MGKISNSGLVALYKKIGLRDPKFFDGKSVVNLSSDVYVLYTFHSLLFINAFA